MELYLKLIDVLFPVFFVIGVGYYLGRKDPNFDTNFITNFAGNIGTPAMIFYTITTTGITLDIFIEYFIYSLVIIGGFSLVGLLFLFILGGYNQHHTANLISSCTSSFARVRPQAVVH